MSNATHRTNRTAAARTGLALDGNQNGGDDWGHEEKPARDWKKAILVTGLGLLSWVATYVGMLELIEANMGELPLVHKLIIGFSVAMLMIMVVWLLDEMFKPNPFSLKLVYTAGYLFLTLISVGFGFGFYWKVLESRGESTRSAESAVTQVQGSLTAASARLDQLQSTLDQLTAVSLTKAQSERATGNSCPASKPGDGPRRKLREDDASRFSFASEFVKGRATSVKAEMGALEGDLIKIGAADASTIDAKTGTRNAFMQGISRKLDGTVTNFNAFRTDPQLKQIRSDLAERAEKSTFPDGAGKTFSCPDGQLQAALRGVVRAIDGLPELEKPKIAAVEGSEATIEAFRRLVASFSGLLQFKLPPSADELRELQRRAIQSVESPTASTALARLNEQPGLSKRDYVPLAIAIFVDLCLLLVAMGRNHDRMSGLVPKMRAAERGPVIQILSRFNDIHRDRQIRENFDLFRHVVFDFHGDYYVAVPLDAPKRLNPHEREDLRLEAQLLSNLFASFEKERIFSRVYSPLLTTGTIRKRLGRQGSKFAASEAFRIYRFKDGAWSDFILGAVMGAAKRVEAEKRTLALRAEELARNTPLPDPAFDLPYATAHSRASGRHGHSQTRQTSAEAETGYSFAGPHRHDAPREAETGRQVPYAVQPDHGDLARQFGSYAAYAARPQTVPRPTEAAPTFADNVHPLYPAGAAEDIDRDLRPANSNTASVRNRATAEPDAPPSAAVAHGVPPGAPLADVVPFAPAIAHADTPPVLRSPQAELAEPLAEAAALMPAVAPVSRPAFDTVDWQSQLGIVMTRVTESISVPMPPSVPPLLAMTSESGGMPEQGELPLTTEDVAVGPGPSIGAASEWTATDMALARRYARGAAE